jgi:hypothetical protein
MTGAPKCLYYAFGGGLGHGMRTLALSRQLVRLIGGVHLVVVNTPFAHTLHAALAQEQLVQMLAFDPSAGPDEARVFVSDVLASFKPDLLVVDTFPRGLGGEFVPIFPNWRYGSRVLISRGLPSAYVDGYGLARFVETHYQLVISPGEPSPFQQTAAVYSAGSFLVRDFEELSPPPQATRLVHGSPNQQIALVVGSGTLDECRAMSQMAATLASFGNGLASRLRLALPIEVKRPVDDRLPQVIRHCPLIECLPAVKLVIGAAGYNLIHETRSLGIRGLFRPQPRKYDRQVGRVGDDSRFSHVDDLLARLLVELEKPTPKLRKYDNGAAEAASQIAQMA